MSGCGGPEVPWGSGPRGVSLAGGAANSAELGLHQAGGGSGSIWSHKERLAAVTRSPGGFIYTGAEEQGSSWFRHKTTATPLG